MKFELTRQQRAWRDEIREFLRENWEGDGLRGATVVSDELGPRTAEFRRRVAERGWWGLNWPEEYGGTPMGAIYRYIFTEEFEYVGAPGQSLTIGSLGPIILAAGTEQNKRDWIPQILSCEYDFAIGYSEPDAGTDLASLKTTAVLDGDEWIINGQKTWNSHAQFATHEWLAVRTDPDAPKHKGISVIIVPLDSPGITVHPLRCWSGVCTNLTFFEDVRVPAGNLIGELNHGWQYMTGQLNYERSSLSTVAPLRRRLDGLVDYCKRTVMDGEPLSARPEVRLKLAELDMDIEVARLFSFRVAAMNEARQKPNAGESSISKIYSSELRTKVAHIGMQILEMYGQLNRRDRDVPLGGAFEQLYREAPIMRFGAGANEIQRNLIAQHRLGLPR